MRILVPAGGLFLGLCGSALGQPYYNGAPPPQYYYYTGPQYAPAPPAAAPAVVLLSADQLDQLTAPVALYPDPLLAQMFPAATYPQDVMSAAQWLQSYPQPAEADIAAQPWDDSIKALVHYPTVLQWMAGNPDWMQAIGAAFINQQADVMNSVQSMRTEAMNAGTLVSSPQQQVVVEPDGTISIMPVQPSMVYVPQYDPSIVYAPPEYPDEPGWGITYGVGFAIGDWLIGDFDWHHHWIDHDDWRWRRDQFDHDRDRHDDHGRTTLASIVDRSRAPGGDDHRWARNPAKPLPVMPPRVAPLKAPPGGQLRHPSMPPVAPKAPKAPSVFNPGGRGQTQQQINRGNASRNPAAAAPAPRVPTPPAPAPRAPEPAAPRAPTPAPAPARTPAPEPRAPEPPAPVQREAPTVRPPPAPAPPPERPATPPPRPNPPAAQPERNSGGGGAFAPSSNTGAASDRGHGSMKH
jgi:hypothetical protein